jgi:endogenous inhibitor of DNA gyrase (YacG/DUF329 family)
VFLALAKVEASLTPGGAGPRVYDGRASLSMSFPHWSHRLPEGISNLRETGEGFEASVAIPTDEEGFFGRECPDCGGFFKLRVDQYAGLPDDLELTCPYCGHRKDHSEFMTSAQKERVLAAAEATALQYMHSEVQGMLRRSFGGGRRLRPGESGVEITYKPGSPPLVRQLPSYVEEAVRRRVRCEKCGNDYAVYGASAFCPVCGPRPALVQVLDSIEAARRAVALEDELPADAREQARAAGVFDAIASDAVKITVTLFEVFAREQFTQRVGGHEQILGKERPTVFQSLTDAERLFGAHAGVSLAAAVDTDVWDRLTVVFEQRHLLAHRHGAVDARYLKRLPASRLKVGQRLVVGRRQAEQALADLETVVRAINAL